MYVAEAKIKLGKAYGQCYTKGSVMPFSHKIYDISGSCPVSLLASADLSPPVFAATLEIMLRTERKV